MTAPSEEKTGSGKASMPDLRAMAADRFPLLPRAKPVCRALETRVARVRELARLASHRTEESLVRAAEAHNLAALIASDCGLPEPAHDLCQRQYEAFRARRPLDMATAKLALQPLINLGRLLIRAGDGTTAYELLEALFRAVATRTNARLNGRTIELTELISHDDDHRELATWMWSVLLADGTRALTWAGRWAEALQHAERHKGIGERLLDGRQVAVLAYCDVGDHDAALGLLASSVVPTPWEEAVAACMKVLCLHLGDHPAAPDIATMMDRYLSLEPADEHTVFHVRLGLTVIDLAAGDRHVPRVAQKIVCDAVESADAYAAQDVLSHRPCRSHTAADDMHTLTGLLRAAGLGDGTIAPHLLGQLMEATRSAEDSIRSLVQGHR